MRKPVSTDRRRRASRELVSSGQRVRLEVHEHPRARRLTLRIGAGGLRLTVPPRTPERAIEGFVARHEGWIEERLAAIPRNCPLAAGGTISLRGEPHRIGADPGGGRGVSSRDGVLTASGSEAELPRRLLAWLKREARADLTIAVARHAARLAVTPGRLRIGDAATRWGSCSSTGTLSFSWRLVMAPPAVLDYLAAHEVAHLREMNHGPRFWALVEELCPDYRAQRLWLRRHGPALLAVGGARP